jgi:hypothetical protein
MEPRKEAFEAGKAAPSRLDTISSPDAKGGRTPEQWLMLGNQPSGATAAKLEGFPKMGYHSVNIYKDKKHIGNLDVDKDSIDNIQTHTDFRHQGVATLADRIANFSAGRHGGKPVEHGTVRTQAGEDWAKAVGGDLPPRIPSFGIQGSRLRDLD